MRILSFSLIALLALVGCGKEQAGSVPDANQIVASSPNVEPEPTELTPCSIVPDALYCDDDGTQGDRVGQLHDGAVVGLFSEFTPNDGVTNNYGRLLELGGDRGPGGGIAITVSGGNGQVLSVGCSGWSASLYVIWTLGVPITAGSHKVYCEADANEVQLWIDGEFQLSQAISYVPTIGSLGVKMAAHSPFFDFAGILQTAIVTDRTLTNSERDALFE